MLCVNKDLELGLYILIGLTSVGSALYIGPNNKYVCNCENDQCFNNGSCLLGYDCKQGFFGYACQYNNVLDNTSFALAELDDNSYDTCVSVNTRVNVHFNYAQVLMARFVVKDNTKFRDIKISFKTTDMESECNGTFFSAKSKVIEYHCQQSVKAYGLTIHNIILTPICHIGITDGRDMAIKSSVSASSYQGDYYSPQGLTDGILTHANGTCLLLDDNDTSLDVFINFTDPILVNVIEFISISENQVDLVSVVVKTWDQDTNLAWNFTIHQLSGKGRKYINDQSQKPLSSLSLHGRQKYGACEVRILGDCPKGNFGLSCSEKCPGKCTWCNVEGDCLDRINRDCSPNCAKNKECFENGICKFGCAAGFYGDKCTSNCSPYCRSDCYSNGTCKSACVTGYYGADCHLKCSPHCARDKECYSNGSCKFGCDVGFHGVKCTSRCSPYCGKDGSCGKDGQCTNKCEPGFYGPHCTYLGLSSHSTDVLTWTCHCPGGKCEDVFGICDLFDYCIHGYFGYNCDYIDLGNHAKQIDPILNDYDNTTCQISKNKSVTVEWSTPIHFSWMSLNFEENASVHNFVVIVQEANVSRIIKNDILRVRSIWPNLYELKVVGGSLLTILDIFWSGSGALCSLHISGGHNLALGLTSLAHTKEHRHRKLQSRPITDGNIGGGNCVNLNSESYQDYEIHFQHSVWINYIHIYPDIHTPANASLSFLLKSETTVEAVHTSIVGVKVSKFRIDLSKTVKSIVILLIKGKLLLCEIEIFGECTPPNYGFACRDICSITCDYERCDYGGRCLHCPKGRSGPYCMTKALNKESAEAINTMAKPCANCRNTCANRFISSLYLNMVVFVIFIF